MYSRRDISAWNQSAAVVWILCIPGFLRGGGYNVRRQGHGTLGNLPLKFWGRGLGRLKHPPFVLNSCPSRARIIAEQMQESLGEGTHHSVLHPRFGTVQLLSPLSHLYSHPSSVLLIVPIHFLTFFFTLPPVLCLLPISGSEYPLCSPQSLNS